MSMGAQRAEAPAAESGNSEPGVEEWNADSDTRDFVGPEPFAIEEPEMPKRRGRWVGALLVLLAIAWTAASIWSIAEGQPALTLGNALQWVAFVSPPLILLGIAWIILGQTPRKEAERFTRAVAAMRSESAALESVLAIVATRLEENHAKLRGEATKLMSLGDEASDRLGRVAYYLSKESASLDKKSEALEAAAEAARVDIGVLLQDLPRAEEQARAVAEAMREAGLTAHEQAGALEGQLAALAARGREADEAAGGAAQRLGAHLARIETTTTTATQRMDEAAASMAGAIDNTMARASDALDSTRSSLDAQSAAMLASIEQHRAALERAGEEAARNLVQRIETISGKVETLASHLAAQDAASHALVDGLGRELQEVEARLASLRETGSASAATLSDSFDNVRSLAKGLSDDLGGGHDRAQALIERAEEMARALNGVTAQLNGDVPAALERVEERADRANALLNAMGPLVGAVEVASASTMKKLSDAEASIERQHQLLEASGTALTDYLMRHLGEVEEKMVALRQMGGSSSMELGEALQHLRDQVSDLAGSLEGGQARAAEMRDQAATLRDALAAISAELDDRMPAALARVEEQAERTRSTTTNVGSRVEALQLSAQAAAEKLAEAEASLARQQEALDAMLARLGEGMAGAETQLRALGTAASEADSAASKLSAETGPELIEALLRVREAANQATERAREAIASVIPQSAAALAEASREAVSGAIGSTVETQMGELGQAAQRAVDTARRASERLTRQLLTIGETASAIEARIDEARREREEKESEHFSRRVALLIESLNSTAIDVTKILSNEVTDSAWAAYLKGDRGVFTRRAVRLLDNSEARAIVQHYENEPEFREQVNRYIHDFESMLRRVLTERDSSALGVTILSSDMGKLYVALAQAIERLR